jgi:hypothetical protein
VVGSVDSNNFLKIYNKILFIIKLTQQRNKPDPTALLAGFVPDDGGDDQDHTETAAEADGEEGRRAAAELLADVMNAGQVYQHCPAAAHWKPALRSIREAVES